MSLSLSTATTKYVRWLVTATAVGAPIDPSTDPVAFAFIPPNTTPGISDWHTGSWESFSGLHFARFLFGPVGGLVLAPATYKVWIKITDNPEVPVEPIDDLTIF